MSLLVIISSPSGGGKDSVINALLKRIPNSTRLITTTTRPKRPGNVDGKDYYFISKEDFLKKIAAGDFLEHNFYAENYYGSEKKHLAEAEKKYALVLTQIEVNGKHNLDKAGTPHLAIFLLPESLEELGNRIRRRGGLTPELIKKRLAIAKQEIKASTDYDYRIVNAEGKLGETIDKIAEIIDEHLKTEANP